MGHEVDEGAAELAVLAGSAYADGDLGTAYDLLLKLLKQRDADPKVLHNLAITEYRLGGSREPRKLLASLEKLRLKVEEARAEAEAAEGVADGLDADASLISYNLALLHYQLKQYAKCRNTLDELFANIEPIDEFLAFKVCFLLLEVQLLLNLPDKAAEVLSYLERSYLTLTKAESARENGSADPDPSDSREWPNKRSARRPPTDVSVEEVRLNLHVFKAKLSLHTKGSKGSKRELKSTLSACAHCTTGLFLKSSLEYQRGNFRKAIKLLSNSCVKTDNDKKHNIPALYFNNMGAIHHCMRRHAAAAFYFTRALHENQQLYAHADKGGISLPAFSYDRRCEMEYNRGLQLLLSGRPQAAFGSFQTALLLLHRQPRVWLRLGETCTAVYVQQQAALAASQEGHGTAGHLVLSSGKSRRLVLPVPHKDTLNLNADQTDTQPDAQPDAPTPAPSLTPAPASAPPSAPAGAGAGAGVGAGAGESEGGVEGCEASLQYGAKCLSNALVLIEAQREGAGKEGTGKEGAGKEGKEGAVGGMERLAVTDKGVGEKVEEHAGGMAGMAWLARLHLSFIALAVSEYETALKWANQVLHAHAWPSLKLYAHLYACDALCHMSRSAEAEPHLVSALGLGDGLVSTVGLTSSNHNGETSAEPDIGAVKNPYAHMGRPVGTHVAHDKEDTNASRAVLYSNLAAVHIMQGDLAQAMQCVNQALALQPKHRAALLCLVYLELRAGNTEVALDILKRQRLPAPLD